jgi:crotonobetainyl-CoA:carnitine CoA-transferase CaiB-like acyl-CoA transferase
MDETGAETTAGRELANLQRSTLTLIRALREHAIENFSRQTGNSGDGRRRGINACVVAEPADVLADPHLAARDFWQVVQVRKQPGRFVRIEAGAAAAQQRHAGEPDRGPLSGLRAGFFLGAGRLHYYQNLGDLGADVIKVESRLRPCLSRLDVQVAASKAGHFDDKPWFAHLNTSKLSIALNMKHPRAFEVLGPLIDWADVVVENFSPGTMAKLGLDHASLSRRHPGIVMISGSVYGQSGPLAQEWGVDGTGGALSGRTYLTGWPDRDPVVPGSVPYGDVIVPSSCRGRPRCRRGESGQGAHVDASMYEICVQQMLLPSNKPSGDRPLRQRRRHVCHQDVYPSAGDDRWVASAVRPEDRDRLNPHRRGRLGAWTCAEERSGGSCRRRG